MKGRHLAARARRQARAVERAAARWYEVQRGTMAALSPTGIAVRDALGLKP